MSANLIAIFVLCTVFYCSGANIKLSVQLVMDNPPDAVIVSVPKGSFAIDALYKAAQEDDTHYNFGGTYYGDPRYTGWYVQTYNGVTSTTNMYWLFYIIKVDGRTILADKGVSQYKLDNTVSSIRFCYGNTENCDVPEP